MKVNKNVTFDFQHFQVINSILEQHHSKTFSGALRILLERAIKNEYVIKGLEKKMYAAQDEVEVWKKRAESHLKPNTITQDISKEPYKQI